MAINLMVKHGESMVSAIDLVGSICEMALCCYPPLQEGERLDVDDQVCIAACTFDVIDGLVVTNGYTGKRYRLIITPFEL